MHLSDIFLIIVPIKILIEYVKGNRDRFYSLITAYSFLFAVIVSLKFMFNVPRYGWIDPFSFPSGHAGLVSGLLYFYPNVITALYIVGVCVLRVLEGAHTVTDVVAGALVGIVSPLVYTKIREISGRETDRQFIHIGASVFFSYCLFLNRWAGVILLFSLLVLGVFLFVLRKKYRIIGEFLERYDRDGTGKGAFTLVAGILIVALLWQDAWKVGFFVGWVDGLATIVGKAFRTKTKSFYGMVGGIFGGIVAALCASLPLWFGVVIAVIEYASPFDDNIALPVATFLLSALV